MGYEWIIPLVVGVAVLNLGAALLARRTARRALLQKRLKLGAIRGQAASAAPVARKFGLLAAKVGGKVSPALGDKMAQAGFLHPASGRIYMGIRVLSMAVGAALGMLVAALVAPSPAARMFIMVGGAGLFFLAPGIYLSRRRSQRIAELRHVLPDVIDLLEISTAAGMGLSMAWNALTEQIRAVSPTMANEMALVNLETHLGSSQIDALRHMVRRTGVDELSSLVALLVQTEQFGTGIAEALRTFAVSMREIRSFNAQERAEKVAVKMLFPMVGFLYPATVMIMVGPGFMTLMHALSAGA